MATKVIFTQWISDEIKDFYFGTEEDANDFDETYRNYISNKEALEEFKNECNEYVSYSSIMYNIQQETFCLEGKYSDELITSMENVIDTTDDKNPYCILYTSLLYVAYPELKNYTWDGINFWNKQNNRLSI